MSFYASSGSAIDFFDLFFDDARRALNSGALTFEQFAHLQAQWSKNTFGPRYTRGPAGPIKHLRKEVDEVLEQIAYVDEARRLLASSPSQEVLDELEHAKDKLLEELADCLFLVFDAVWRGGFGLTQLRNMLSSKLQKNMSRVWPPPAPGDEAVEHDRTKDGVA